LSKIIVTDDFEEVIKELKPDEKIVVEELKVEDVQKIRELAYIAQKEKKVILIAAEKYNLISQNALLKLLEEPPKNIDFVLLAKSKYSLLDTIKSRLPIEKRIFHSSLDIDIDISKITNEFILELLKKDLELKELKALIYKIVKEKELSAAQMEILSDAIKMLELNIDKKAVLSLIMLSLKDRK